jgi:hypothetical protein
MQRRVLAAFVFCLAGIAISLLLLTAGTKANFLENAALAIVRKSSPPPFIKKYDFS